VRPTQVRLIGCRRRPTPLQPSCSYLYLILYCPTSFNMYLRTEIQHILSELETIKLRLVAILETAEVVYLLILVTFVILHKVCLLNFICYVFQRLPTMESIYQRREAALEHYRLQYIALHGDEAPRQNIIHEDEID